MNTHIVTAARTLLATDIPVTGSFLHPLGIKVRVEFFHDYRIMFRDYVEIGLCHVAHDNTTFAV